MQDLGLAGHEHMFASRRADDKVRSRTSAQAGTRSGSARVLSDSATSTSAGVVAPGLRSSVAATIAAAAANSAPTTNATW